MAETTGIRWTRSTFNPWIGCTEVSPGCDACYARELDARYRYGGAAHWGAGVPRHRTAASTWGYPIRWNRAAAHELATGKVLIHDRWKGKPGFWPVFPSLCDPFDNEVPNEWVIDFWQLIRATPALTWMLLTKRIGNVRKMAPSYWAEVRPPANVWLGVSIVNQEEANRDIPKLLAAPAAKRFVSYEPALGPVDWRHVRVGDRMTLDALTGLHAGHAGPVPRGDINELLASLPTLPGPYQHGIDQIIVGGESDQGGHKARPFVLGWGKDTIRQCHAAGVPCFFKQAGSNATNREGVPHPFKDRAGADPSEWPDELRVQEFPA